MSKWVWDEWEEDDAEQRSLGSSITESTLGTPAILARGTAPPPARASASRQSFGGASRATFDDVRRKVGLMMDELAERKAVVERLHAELRAARAAGDAARARRADESAAAAAAADEAHAAALARQRAFLEQVRADGRELARQAEQRAARARAARDDERGARVSAARGEGAKALKAARDAWSGAERAKLGEAVEKRRAAIKNDAIAALEPELHRLISSNRAELRARKAASDLSLIHI